MIVVVDGYNIIKQLFGQKHISEHQRKGFINKMTRYIQQRSLQGVIVFDGGQTDYPSSHKQGAITVVFSGYKQTADDVIKQYLEAHREYEILLVSSDHELRLFAHALNKETITAHEFYHRYVDQPVLEKNRSSNQQLVKLSVDAPVELDALMQQATQHIQPKEEDGQQVQHVATQTVSKKERKRERLLDKLR